MAIAYGLNVGEFLFHNIRTGPCAGRRQAESGIGVGAKTLLDITQASQGRRTDQRAVMIGALQQQCHRQRLSLHPLGRSKR